MFIYKYYTCFLLLLYIYYEVYCLILVYIVSLTRQFFFYNNFSFIFMFYYYHFFWCPRPYWTFHTMKHSSKVSRSNFSFINKVDTKSTLIYTTNPHTLYIFFLNIAFCFLFNIQYIMRYYKHPFEKYCNYVYKKKTLI